MHLNILVAVVLDVTGLDYEINGIQHSPYYFLQVKEGLTMTH